MPMFPRLDHPARVVSTVGNSRRRGTATPTFVFPTVVPGDRPANRPGRLSCTSWWRGSCLPLWERIERGVTYPEFWTTKDAKGEIWPRELFAGRPLGRAPFRVLRDPNPQIPT